MKVSIAVLSISALFLANCMTNVSSKDAEACIDCANNVENQIVGSNALPQSDQRKRSEPDFEEEEANTSSKIEPPNLEEGKPVEETAPKSGAPKRHKTKKQKHRDGKSQSKEKTKEPEVLEKTETAVPPAEGPSPGVEDLLKNPSLSSIGKLDNPPELIQDAPIRHGSLDASRHYEEENSGQKEQKDPPIAVKQPRKHPIFAKYPDNGGDKLSDLPHDSSEQGNRDENTSDEDEKSTKDDQEEDAEPRCFSFSDIYNGAGKMVRGFGRKEGFQDKISVLGHSLKNAVVSVAQCGHSVWNGFTQFLGLGMNARVEAHKYSYVNEYVTHPPEVSSKKTKKSKQPVTDKPADEEDVAEPAANDEQEDEQSGMVQKAKRLAIEAGEKFADLFSI